MLFASYPPEGGDADRLATMLAREQGLRLDADLARRLADASGGDRAVLASEIEKLALYADASPEQPREVSHDMIDAIGADNGEADLTRFVDAVIGGQEALLERELARLAGEGQEGIPLVRALLRRLISLAAARTEVERGASPSAAADRVGRALFWKEKNAIARDVGRWPAPRIARAIDRLSLLDRELRRSAGPGTIGADAEFFAIARAASRRR
jgi:DNA polymerase-3 subunit delta